MAGKVVLEGPVELAALREYKDRRLSHIVRRNQDEEEIVVQVDRQAVGEIKALLVCREILVTLP